MIKIGQNIEKHRNFLKFIQISNICEHLYMGSKNQKLSIRILRIFNF